MESSTEVTNKVARRRGALSPEAIARRDIDARAVEMRVAGRTFDEIASSLGLANRGVAHKAVERAFRRQVASSVEELRAEELARLDAIIAVLWDRVAAGELEAVDRVLKAIDCRARIAGLYAPRKQIIGVELRSGEPSRRLEALAALDGVIDVILARPERGDDGVG